MSEELKTQIAELIQENNVLRALLGNSSKPCPYCNLPAHKQAECPAGFPGCSRADDQLLSEHFAAGYAAQENEKDLQLAKILISLLLFSGPLYGKKHQTLLDLGEKMAKPEFQRDEDFEKRVRDLQEQYKPSPPSS